MTETKFHDDGKPNPFRDKLGEWTAKGNKIKFEPADRGAEVLCTIIGPTGNIKATGQAEYPGDAFDNAIAAIVAAIMQTQTVEDLF